MQTAEWKAMAITKRIERVHSVSGHTPNRPVSALVAMLVCASARFGLSGSAAAKTYAYVTNRLSGTVSVIEADGWTVAKTLKVGEKPFGIYLFDPARGEMDGNR
jgi:YVTN family beta-propeller protein